MLKGDVASFLCYDLQLKGDIASFLSCFGKWMAVIGLGHKKFQIPIILHDNIFLYGNIVPPKKNLNILWDQLTENYGRCPHHDQAYMFGDNKSVVTSSTIPQPILNIRHNMLSYHRVREAIAASSVYTSVF